ncbi:hypothetical protein [Asticcacaulis sp. AC402]|uniref:hypothetical protein n=1 Tax=Asticcacaulis sp. AC402 TaxID=1282361 RepID=UPI0003C3C3F9|nr:hypothetical protein [Asticcacaulis sp. AC402]ESQ75059.1 hypothetical protein ABAC402_11685 [Asticcacaulis sp. AC402]
MIKGWGSIVPVVAASMLMACAPVSGTDANLAQAGASRLESLDLDRMRGDADTVADILQRGLAAEARGDGDALLVQAQALSLMGARPEDGAPDLARQWATRARALGARPTTAVAFRGRTLGPGYRSGKVSANGAFRTRQTYSAGQRAEIVLVPVDDAPLSLEVRDDEGASVCAVAPSTRNLGCRWVPTFTGANEIEVRNDNPVTVNFYIVLN